MSMDWFDSAAQALRAEMASNQKVDGMNFLKEFFLENREDYFSEVEFEDIDRLVTDSFDNFQSMLSGEDFPWVEVSSGGKWFARDSSPIISETVTTDEFKLSPEDKILLERPIYELNEALLKDFSELLSKLRATSKTNETYICAKKAAQCADSSATLSFSDKAKHWVNVSELAAKNPDVNSSYYYQQAAKWYQKDFNHLDSAANYKKSYELLKNDDDGKLNLMRACRNQFEMCNNHNEASKIYYEEKDLEKENSNVVTKILLTFFKYICGYGESPVKVLFSSIIVIITSALLHWVIGIEGAGQELSGKGDLVLINEFWNSLYFSIVTFTTLGYGDYTPTGLSGKFLACIVSLSGLLLVSLFMVTIVRRYSRA